VCIVSDHNYFCPSISAACFKISFSICNRYYLIEATGSVVRQLPEYNAFYQKKFDEVKTHQHKRALALTSRKFIRLVFGLLAKNQLFVPQGVYHTPNS